MRLTPTKLLRGKPPIFNRIPPGIKNLSSGPSDPYHARKPGHFDPQEWQNLPLRRKRMILISEPPRRPKPVNKTQTTNPGHKFE
jgi:hypothetical protein